MIIEQLLTGLVRTSAQKLSTLYPEHGAEIALRSADVMMKLRALVEGSNETNGTALCLEVCAPLDMLLRTDDVALRQSIDRIRVEAQTSLLRALYRDARRAAPDDILSINREEEVSGIVAEASAKLRILHPKSFGPEWFKFELGQTEYDELREFAYDLESDSVKWDRVAAMLPQSVRAPFDTRELGEIPERIETREQFLAALEVLERRGISRTELKDFANITSNIRTVQGFTAILEYVERTAKKS